jgi:dihydroxyacetone kinase-like protein
MAGMTVDSLRHAITAILATLELRHQELTELDGKIGDGDLGITLLKAFRELDRIKGDLPDDLGRAFMQCAEAVSKVSSSSFGTLLATSMMTAAKEFRGRTEADWSQLPELMGKAVAAMSARGKASLGDKTVLDALSAAARLSAGVVKPATLLAASRQGIRKSLEDFRDRPSKIGRARIFADRTVGIDDPGMVALEVMAASL